MGAIVGYLLGEAFTVPSIAELTVSPDGGVIVVPVDADGRRQHPVFIGAVAELDDEQWRELADRVRLRLGSWPTRWGWERSCRSAPLH